MRSKILILIFISTLFSCKENASQIIIDNLGISYETTYKYNYKEGRKIHSERIDYTMVGTNRTDSVKTYTNYIYNDKNLLVQETVQSDLESEVSKKRYFYNSLDSLTKELNISASGDTMLWKEYGYFPDGRKPIFNRYIHLSFNDFETILSDKEQKYDTILNVYKYEYKDNLCTLLKTYDALEHLTEKQIYKYSSDRHTETLSYIYINNTEIFDKRRILDYSCSEKHPKYFVLDMNNDTIGFNIIEFNEDDELTRHIDVFDGGNIVIESKYKENREVSSVDFDKREGILFRRLYEYYENGDLKRELIYEERLKIDR